ncbi:MAG: hypothetical protein J6Y90_03895, partial [Lachnospiraceae bacterium]|nr:hypothetical protein [Lachnospiraceae bacterium]
IFLHINCKINPFLPIKLRKAENTAKKCVKKTQKLQRDQTPHTLLGISPERFRGNPFPGLRVWRIFAA